MHGYTLSEGKRNQDQRTRASRCNDEGNTRDDDNGSNRHLGFVVPEPFNRLVGTRELQRLHVVSGFLLFVHAFVVCLATVGGAAFVIPLVVFVRVCRAAFLPTCPEALFVFRLAVAATRPTCSRGRADSSRILGDDVEPVFWLLRVSAPEAGHHHGDYQHSRSHLCLPSFCLGMEWRAGFRILE